MEAASLARAPPAVKAPIHTQQHTGQHGDDGLAELIPWSWPGGSHGATTPLPRWSWGSELGSGLSAYHTGRGAIQGRTPGLHHGPAIMGSDPTRGRQCGHTGSTGRPGKKMVKPPPPTHTHRLLLQCSKSKQCTEFHSDDCMPLSRGYMRAQYPLLMALPSPPYHNTHHWTKA